MGKSKKIKRRYAQAFNHWRKGGRVRYRSTYHGSEWLTLSGGFDWPFYLRHFYGTRTGVASVWDEACVEYELQCVNQQ